MERSQIALQLFTVREHAKTEADLAVTLEKVADIGYQAVQVSGIGADIPREFVRECCEKNKLTICATHENSELILSDPEAIVKNLAPYDCKLTAYPFPRNIDFASEASVGELISGLAKATDFLAEHGITLAYHNHRQEFRRLNGQLILDRIYNETPIQGEIDTYWVQVGGGDPVAWCEKLANRLPILHLKDYMINDADEVVFGPVGKGNLNFPAIIRAAEAAGCRWFCVEQDRTPEGAFNAIQMSFEYLAGLAN